MSDPKSPDAESLQSPGRATGRTEGQIAANHVSIALDQVASYSV